jgi:polyisoprenoid-binding protein YceI
MILMAQKLTFSLDVNSIDTNQADRDGHLKSADFFAADQYPTLDFAGALKKVSGNTYKLEGNSDHSGYFKSSSI